MSVCVFAAGTHRPAAPIPGATPPPISGALAIVVNRGDVRTRALLVELLDELEQSLATEKKRALYSLPATHQGEPS